MQLRDLTIIGLRLMAVWLGCTAVLSLASLGFVVFYALSPSAIASTPLGQILLTMLSPVIIVVVQIGLAAVLFRFAPGLAGAICKDIPSDTEIENTLSLGAGDVYRLGALLVGVYIVSRAIGPAVRATVELMSQGSYAVSTQSTVAGMVEAGVLAAFGVALIFGARGLGKFLASLGHDSKDIPAQQFSLRLLLIAVVACALILFLIRILVQ